MTCVGELLYQYMPATAVLSPVSQGKYDAALAAVRGPLGASFSLTAERREAEAATLQAKGDLQAAAELYKQALQEQPDDWAVLLLYLDCMLPATASTLPACCSTGVAQMVTGVEATTRPGCQAGGLAALMAAMKVGELPFQIILAKLCNISDFVSLCTARYVRVIPPAQVMALPLTAHMGYSA